MRTDYDGVKFYSRYDMSVGWELKKAEPIIIDFSAEKTIEDSMKSLSYLIYSSYLKSGLHYLNGTMKYLTLTRRKLNFSPTLLVSFFLELMTVLLKNTYKVWLLVI
jgi:hypothetical protein